MGKRYRTKKSNGSKPNKTTLSQTSSSGCLGNGCLTVAAMPDSVNSKSGAAVVDFADSATPSSKKGMASAPCLNDEEDELPTKAPPGINADKDYKPGDLIFTSKPYACVVNERYLQEFCHHCFTWNKAALKKCGRCLSVFYCSVVCQKADWANHQTECKSLCLGVDFTMGYIDQSEDVSAKTRLIGRMVRASEKERDSFTFASETVCGQKMLFPTLYSNIDIAKPHQNENYIQRVIQLKKYLSPNLSTYDNRELIEIVLKQEMNYVYITRFGTDRIGIGLYLGHALMNHSCKPNVAVSFNKNLMSVRATEEIKKGEEIFTAYIDLLRFQSKRKEILKDNYHFVCNCTRCLDDEFQKSICAPFNFTRLNELQRTRTMVTPSAAPGFDVPTLRTFLVQWEDCSHNYWVWYVRALDVFVQKCYFMKYYIDVVKYGDKLVEKLQHYYGKYSMIVGRRMMWHAESLWRTGKKQEAFLKYSTAFEMFKVCAGEDSVECKFVQMCIESGSPVSDPASATVDFNSGDWTKLKYGGIPFIMQPQFFM